MLESSVSALLEKHIPGDPGSAASAYHMLTTCGTWTGAHGHSAAISRRVMAASSTGECTPQAVLALVEEYLERHPHAVKYLPPLAKQLALIAAENPIGGTTVTQFVILVDGATHRWEPGYGFREVG